MIDGAQCCSITAFSDSRQFVVLKLWPSTVNVKQVVALVSRGYRVCVLTARHFYWAIGRQGHRRRRRPVSCPA